MKTKIALLSILLFVSACSSTPKSLVDLSRVGEEDILQTYGKYDEIKKADQFKMEDRIVTATAMTTISADGGRPEAAVKIAQASARATIAKTIENKLESFLQVANENSSIDSQEMHELITEVSKLTANELKPGKTYYEKVRVYGDSGLPHTEYRAWAQMSMEEAQFKHQVVDSMRRQEGKLGLSEEFHKSVAKNWDKMLTEETPKPVDERKPASIETKPVVEAVKQAIN